MKRSLAIEELGTSFEIEKRVPLVRLKGRWLKAAGFTQGQRVRVSCLSPGVIELRLETQSETPEQRVARLAIEARFDAAISKVQRVPDSGDPVTRRPALSDWENQTVLHFSSAR